MATVLEITDYAIVTSATTGSLTLGSNTTQINYKEQNSGSSLHPGIRWHIDSSIAASDLTQVRFNFYVNQFGNWTPDANMKVIRKNVSSFDTGSNRPYTLYTNESSSSVINYTTTWPTSGYIGWITLDLADVQAAMNDAGHDHATNGTDLAVCMLAANTGTGSFIQIQSESYPSGNPAILEVTYDPPVVLDGLGESTGTVKAPGKMVGRWFGYDAPTSANYGGIIPMITAGLGDIPMTDIGGENPLGYAWQLATGNPAGPMVKMRSGGRGPIGDERDYIFLEDHVLGGSTGPFAFWKPSDWFPEITAPLTTASLRFYYDPPSPTLVIEPYVIRFLKEGSTQWSIRMNGNTTNYTSGEIQILTPDGNTSYSSNRLSTGDYNRIEIQISRDVDPSVTLRCFSPRYDDDIDDPTVEAHIVQSVNVSEANLEFDEIQLGHAAKTGAMHARIADFEFWTDYDLNGVYENPIVNSTKGFPFEDPTYEWHSFEQDGGSDDFIELEDMGVIRSVDADGTNVLMTDQAAGSVLWDSSIAGTSGNVTAGSSNNFSAVQGNIPTYSTTLQAVLPDNAIDYSVAAGEQSTTDYTLAGPTADLYGRVVIHSSDYSVTGGDADLDILRAEDANGDAVFTFEIDFDGSIGSWIMALCDGDAAFAAEQMNLLTLEDGEAYCIEFYYTNAAFTNLTVGRNLVSRITRVSDGEILSAGRDSGMILEKKRDGISKVRFGPGPTKTADTGGVDNGGGAIDITMAGHALDTADFIGFPSQSRSRDVVAGLNNSFDSVSAAGTASVVYDDTYSVSDNKLALWHTATGGDEGTVTHTVASETEYYTSNEILLESNPASLMTILSYTGGVTMARVAIDTSGYVGIYDGSNTTPEFVLGKISLNEVYRLEATMNDTDFKATLYNSANSIVRATGTIIPSTVAAVDGVTFGASGTGTASVGTASHMAGTTSSVSDWNSGLAPKGTRFTDVDTFFARGQVVGGIDPDGYGGEHLNLPYNAASNYRDLDLFIPPGTPPANGWPIVVWVHGGSWTGGSKEVLPESLKQICLANGWAIASVGYQLAFATIDGLGVYPSPAYDLNTVSGRWPTFVCDFKEAAQWLALPAQESTYSIDGSRMIASGYSAGGFNALAAVFTRDLASDGGSFDLTLAGNSGATYQYSNVADPVFKGAYVFAPPTNVGKLYDWQAGPGETEGMLTGAPFSAGQQIIYYVARNMMAYSQRTDWQNDIDFLSVLNWSNLNKNNIVPVGSQSGLADYFVFSDLTTESYPAYGQAQELRDALNLTGLPAGVDTEHLSPNPYHHDWVGDFPEFYQFINFVQRYI